MSDTPSIGLEGIEARLRQILDTVKVGQDDRLDPLLDELEELVASLDFSAARGSDPERLARIRVLWKEAALTLATAGQGARSELRRISTGRKTIAAYRPN